MNAEGKVATAEDAARVDANPPLDQLMKLQQQPKDKVAKGECVVYWMRMEDMRRELSCPGLP
jgi:deoxyribodipyrimidine photo-lyase